MTDRVKLADLTKCTGCMACVNICKHNAIAVFEDADGFEYPQINYEKCVNCGMCVRVCPIINPILKKGKYQKVFAAVGHNIKEVKESSSGGIFSLLAKEVLLQGGKVYGCRMDDALRAVHTAVETEEGLENLRGSKYIQSSMGIVYSQVEKDLYHNKNVLFSGTPCQAAGLRAYLKKEYDNLLIVDLVCHGVPSYKFFQEYIQWFEKKKNVKILSYDFRDKTKTDLGCIAKIRYLKGKKEKIRFSKYSADFYYYYYYMLGKIYRKSCYFCPYASVNRVSDITLGDFWGITDIHPEINIENGMSVVMINSSKGQKYFDKIEAYKYPSNLEEATAYNKSIISSINYPKERDEILRLSRECGGDAIERFFRKEVGIKQLIYFWKGIVPIKVKRKIKKTFHWRK